MIHIRDRMFSKIKGFTRYSPSATIPQVTIIMVVDREESYESVSKALECLEKSYLVLDSEVVFVIDRVEPEVEGLFLRLGGTRSLSIVRVDPLSTIAE